MSPLRRRAGSSVRRKSLILELSQPIRAPPMSHSSMLQRIPLEHPFLLTFFARLAHEKYRARRSRLGPLRRGAGGRPDRCAAGSAGDGLGHMAPAAGSDRRRSGAAPASGGLLGDFSDFALWRLEPRQVHAVAGFGRIATFTAAQVFEGPGVEAIAAIEEEALTHMNRDHRDAVQLYATRLAGTAAGNWTMAAVDRDGFTLVEGSRSARVAFDRPVANAIELRTALAEMAHRARHTSVC